MQSPSFPPLGLLKPTSRWSFWQIRYKSGNNEQKLTAHMGWISRGLGNECLSRPGPPFICWSPNTKCDGIWMWGLWEVVRSWERSLHEWDERPHKKRHERDDCSLCHVCNPGKGFSREHSQAGILLMGFQPPELWENKFLLLKLPNRFHFCYRSLPWPSWWASMS